MNKILVIAPYQGLKELFLEVNEDLQKNIHVEVGDLYKGLAIAKENENKGYDVIISRGATAILLQDHCQLPVVDVKISGYDILRTLTLIKGYPEKIGVMSYRNTIQGADVVGKLLEMDLTFFPISTEMEIEGQIRSAIDQNIQVIIGDRISTYTASQMGLKAILITSGRESVEEALKEAEKVAYYTKKERTLRQLYESIVQDYPDGILVMDEHGQIQVLNDKAEKLLDLPKEQATVQKLRGIHPALGVSHGAQSGTDIKEIIEMNGDTVILNKSTIAVQGNLPGELTILQTVSDIQETESLVRQKQSLKSSRATKHFNHLVASSPAMKEVIRTAKQFSKSNSPLLIYGEPGTGKHSLAQAIHNASGRKKQPFLFINCEAFNEKNTELKLLGDHQEQVPGIFEIAHGGTVFIDAIGKLSLSLQAKLINILMEKKVSRQNGGKTIPIDVRIIAAHPNSLHELVESGRFREDLYYLLNGGTIVIPPLRERREDIRELIRWFIVSANLKIGKQIVGCREEVQNRLIQASWPGNVLELELMVERMCVFTSGPFIELKDVLPFLEEMDMNANHQPHVQGVDIAGKTLDQLEKEIISKVLEEENHNQTSVAKRLGINRSTLWRKIKEIELNQ
ncbi:MULTISPECIES: PrpR N-terminal domain-containing protein [unclassified Paenibacillus]|uniref:PrpR N-terminal domain-containing protein n=1 Tax=unclassified Paenibacillus TaxID=185978 RepID=UPI001AEB6101|nr:MULTISPECIES: PrpR N-terminal domain-containing protein [unclassified Paenibacillus]MBP1153310.1 transcriptional regulator with PAS, ATPase and Fis domain [Paenibacillus sp. PvP091]MBP1171307.1 transcriptional regulator with PAS, ATPase and Fis domain [Paenibacillus sp. PvR098]MBP2442335.1 transcriptional regulator with PAS, ATPase and Fis domain [Paenibacillus sp. PvP052]